jgi:riboflavin kinase/FMN adenylyltransferase
MQILRSIADLAQLSGPVVLAAGTFDGLHLGHQALIRRAQEEAFRLGGTVVILSFDRHPASVTRPDKAPKLLTSKQKKIALLERLGVPVLLLLEFNEALAAIPAEEFIASIAAAAKPLHKICLGSQWSFGRGGAGDIFLLEKLGGELGFSVESITAVEVGGKPISSTRIRKAIATGNFHEATACLGRSFLLIGSVVPGAGLGMTIGFPTANLAVEGMQLPPDGVYAVRVQINGEGSWSGVANIGVRPTVDHSMAPKRSVEIHLFDQDDNLVGKELATEFVEFLRGEHKFPDLAALTAQISNDCKQARHLLSERF